MEQKENIEYILITEDVKSILGLFASAEFRNDDAPQSYRTINHYDKMGLLFSTRESSQGWRKFDAYELIWIYIIDQLRKFGFPLDEIKKIKDKMSKGAVGLQPDGSYISRPFEFVTAISLVAKTELFYIVLGDGRASFYDSQSQWLLSAPDSYMKELHISIPLSPIIKSVWSEIEKKDPEVKLPEKNNISLTQTMLLKHLSNRKDLKSAKITFENGDASTVYYEVVEDPKAKIVELLKKDPFQTITITMRNGKVQHIYRLISEKK